VTDSREQMRERGSKACDMQAATTDGHHSSGKLSSLPFFAVRQRRTSGVGLRVSVGVLAAWLLHDCAHRQLQSGAQMSIGECLLWIQLKGRWALRVPPGLRAVRDTMDPLQSSCTKQWRINRGSVVA